MALSCTMVMFAALMWEQDVVRIVLLLTYVVIGSAICGQRPTRIVSALYRFWPLLAFSLAIHIGVSSYFALKSNPLTLEFVGQQVISSAPLALRVIAVLWLTIVLTKLHPADAYFDDLFRLRFGPKIVVRFLSHAELLLGSAISFIPLLLEEWQRIQWASRSRGLIQPESWWGKVKHYRQLIFPLIVLAVRRAELRAIALKARGYDPRIEKTHMYRKPYGILDGLPLLVTMLFSTLIVLL